jgi:hypothetical protein
MVANLLSYVVTYNGQNERTGERAATIIWSQQKQD